MTNDIFTDLTKPGRRAVWATGVFAALQVAFSLVHVYQNGVITRFLDGSADIGALEQSDTIVGYTAIAFMATLLIAIIINGRFIYLASRNAAAIHFDPDAIKPGWAVGWYFVPFANLWMPFTAMKQTWARLIPSEGGTPLLLPLWWFSWIGMNFYDGFTSNQSTPNALPDYIAYNQSVIISGFLWLIPSAFFITIIRRLAQAEHNPAEVFA
ncbi:uncharacterized protein DUF4328 [Yoonia maricola]|uniref:Uncharacterized protein DUF4328 n=1 Tax=Yoonia maricola TaxID=420999 RepID=A0A2M8WL92_9RHOB|nr:DUF4328 domain-containing protein [Yoonia maricola]PJI91691.1 uncharacterized protein DUF4328 [Yoonia maricola]